ncbi:MAG: thiosulfate oxidation carrier protein SoxY [Alphaproteobacteria bacterium]|nr:MAG: thiosulfate oxidation carrier protein SoxY [Alphaproteobacteria bacterium]
MNITRRDALAIGAGGIAALAFAPAAFGATADEAIAAFTGGATPGEGGIDIKAPEIAENGNVVPIEVNAPGAEEILVLAPANPSAEIFSVKFGPAAGAQRFSTRARLAKTQDVTAIARMADGSFVMAKRTVKVTVGGCGG